MPKAAPCTARSAHRQHSRHCASTRPSGLGPPTGGRSSASSRAALHAKLVAADERVALLGSANLTDKALACNLELGVIIRDPASSPHGPPLPIPHEARHRPTGSLSRRSAANQIPLPGVILGGWQ